MQTDLRENEPDLEIEILGMNNFSQASGNESISEGRDIPWLQDTNADQDAHSDNWLTSWPFVYRDVVIVDANNIAVDVYNVTINSLEEPESYATLRQMLIDVATGAIDAKDDSVAVVAGERSDIDVLGNDEGLSRLEIQSISDLSHGTAEIVTVEVPADLDSAESRIPELILSEIVPGEYIELYTSEFTEIDLGTVNQILVSGQQHIALSDLAAGHVIPARGYEQIPWPDSFIASSASGEFILFRDDGTSFDDATKIDDFVAWGEPIPDSRIDLAVKANKWYGPPDGTLDEGAIQRIPGTLGDEVHSYDNHRPSTPGDAINSAIESEQIVRYTPDPSHVGEATFSYTVTDYDGNTDTALVSVSVSHDAHPWQNPVNKHDINNDGSVSPIDALAVINFLNRGFRGQLPTELNAPLSPQPFVDCSGDNYASPIDALLVINHLNAINRAESGAPAAIARANQLAAARPEFVEDTTEKEHDNLATVLDGIAVGKRNQRLESTDEQLPLIESFFSNDLLDRAIADDSTLEVIDLVK